MLFILLLFSSIGLGSLYFYDQQEFWTSIDKVEHHLKPLGNNIIWPDFQVSGFSLQYLVKNNQIRSRTRQNINKSCQKPGFSLEMRLFQGLGSSSESLHSTLLNGKDLVVASKDALIAWLTTKDASKKEDEAIPDIIEEKHQQQDFIKKQQKPLPLTDNAHDSVSSRPVLDKDDHVEEQQGIKTKGNK